ncbi:MAG: DUF1292 domain-containing protein [Clostridia bacterium]|nr:DUF1292 domain-containing protein [Clostridia bacterium]
MDENKDYDFDIVSVVDEEGVEHIFEELDRIETDDGKRYVALLPVFDDAEEILDDDGDVFILEVTEENGDPYLVQIEDEKVLEEVAEIFEERLSDLFEEPDEDEAE